MMTRQAEFMPSGTAGASEAEHAQPFVDFNRVWLAYNDDLARKGEFAVEDISLQVA